MTEVTADNLNNVMEFDHVIRVAADGTVSDSPYSVGSRNAYFDLNVAQDGTDEFDVSEGWELLTGFTGQYSYNGPVMHVSEFIGGGMARHILETPGDYVALEVSGRCEYDGSTDCDVEQGCDCQPAGWAVAFKPASNLSFEVAITGDVTDDEHAANGATRANGWIDPKWSMTELYENREDVRTEVFETKTEALEYITETIGATEDGGDGTFYAADSRQDMQSGDVWSYAAHLTVTNTETGE